MGAGITVRVVDDGVNGEHVDLRDNFTVYAGDVGIGGADEHGTRVAGVIAARDNDRGGRGVAPRASIYSYKLPPGEPSDDAVQDAIQLAMVHDLDVTAVSNNHWGILNLRTGDPRIAPAGWEMAIERGVTEGFGGKGISYVTAGASWQWDADANLDEYGNHYGVITVCAVNHQDIRYSSAPGANLWLCAPAGAGINAPEITTTDLGSYTERFSGTSAAAPIVSGVVALMRSANMDLTWRDVKLILAASARQNDSSNGGWEQGALRYGSDTDYYWFNHDYGFGVVDAGAAVALAAGWSTTLPELRELTLASQGAPVNIPDAPASGFGETVTTSIVVDTDYVGFIEFVEINLDIDHDSYTNLQIDLVSPSGATSRLARRATLPCCQAAEGVLPPGLGAPPWRGIAGDVDPAHQGRPPPEHGNPQVLEPHVLRAGRSAREAHDPYGDDRPHLSRCLLVRPHRHRGLPRDELRSAPHREQRSGQVTFQLDSQH